MSRDNPKRFKSLPMPRNPACPLKLHCEMSSRELSVTMASLAVFGNVPRPLTDNLLYKSTSNSPTAVKLTLPFWPSLAIQSLAMNLSRLFTRNTPSISSKMRMERNLVSGLGLCSRSRRECSQKRRCKLRSREGLRRRIRGFISPIRLFQDPLEDREQNLATSVIIYSTLLFPKPQTLLRK